MVESAADHGPVPSRWRELLKPSPERIQFAARLALICALTTLVTEIYQTPDAALTAYVAFFLNRPERTTSLILCIAFTIVITVVIGIVFLVARQVADDPMLRIFSISLLSFGLLFLASASKLKPLAGTVALIAAYALDLLGTIQTGELATRALLYAWLFVGIPAGVSFVVNLLLAPAPRKSAERLIARRLEVAARGDTAELRALVHEGNNEVLTLLKLAKIERSASAADLARLRQEAISSWATVTAVYTGSVAGPLVVEELPEEKEAGGFLMKDAFSNPEHVQFALKTTAAAMFCYLLYSLLDWPGIHTAFLTCYIVAQTTAAESVEKLTLRILGCVIGAAIGIAAIVYITPSLTSIEDLMLVVFVGAFGAAYVAAGSPRVSYAGFQIAFAFFLCLIQGSGPAVDMVTARDRVIGILLGNLVAYVALVHIWPMSVTRRIDAALAGVFERLGRTSRTDNRTERLTLAASAQASLTAINTDIGLAHYEPPAIRSSAQWLDSRSEAVAQARELGARLAVAASESDRQAISERLGKIQRSLVAFLAVGLAGCATHSLNLAPPAPDKPWQGDSYVLPPNPQAVVEKPEPPSDIDPSHAYTLPELIDVAQMHNPATRVAWENARSAALAAGIAKAAYLPNLSASVVGAYQTNDRTVTAGGTRLSGESSAHGSISALSMQWLLFDFGERAATVAAAEQLTTMANISFTAVHQQVIYRVSLAYYTHAAAQARVTTAEQALVNAKKVEAAAEARYAQGIGTTIEVAQAHQATAQAELGSVHAKGQEEDTYTALVGALGISPLTQMKVVELGRRTLSPDLNRPVQDVVNEALARRTDVLGAFAAHQASVEKLRAAKAEFMPKVFLAGTASYSTNGFDIPTIPGFGQQASTINIGGNNFGGTVILGLTVPIYDGGVRRALEHQAKSDVARTDALLEQIRDDATREIVAAGNGVRTSLAALSASRALASAAQTVFDAALDAYQNGVGSITDVTRAETQLLEANNASTDAYSQALTSAATLALAAGTLGKAPE